MLKANFKLTLSLTLAFSLLPLAFAATVIVRGPNASLFGVAGSGGGGGGPSTNYLNPAIYFRFDETNDMDVMVDVIGGLNLTNTSATPTSIAGQITNAYEFASGFIRTEFERPTSGAWDFGDTNFAIRFWVKTSGDSGDENFFFNDDFTDGLNAYFTGICCAGNHHIKFEIDNGGSYTSLTTTNILTDGSWHRVVLWHKQGTEIAIKLDNATTETLSYTNTLSSTTADVVWTSGATSSDPIIRFDELAVWKGYVPTEDELLYDWNSGAGRSYPLQ